MLTPQSQCGLIVSPWRHCIQDKEMRGRYDCPRCVICWFKRGDLILTPGWGGPQPAGIHWVSRNLSKVRILEQIQGPTRRRSPSYFLFESRTQLTAHGLIEILYYWALRCPQRDEIRSFSVSLLWLWLLNSLAFYCERVNAVEGAIG